MVLNLLVYTKNRGKNTHKKTFSGVISLNMSSRVLWLPVFCTGGNWSKWVLGVVKVADPWYSPATPLSLRLKHSLHSSPGLQSVPGRAIIGLVSSSLHYSLNTLWPLHISHLSAVIPPPISGFH